MESSGVAPKQEVDLQADLQALKDMLEKRGIDPEKTLEAINDFKEAQRGLSDAMAHYNEQAARLAEANGYPMTEEQEAKFPAMNMRVDNDLRTYLRLKGSSAPENKNEDLPVELL